MGAICGHMSGIQGGSAFEAAAQPVSMKRRVALVVAVATFAWLRTTGAAAAPHPHLSAPDAPMGLALYQPA